MSTDGFPHMKRQRYTIAAALLCLFASVSSAEVAVTIERSRGGNYVFDSIPLPANNDAATAATVSLIDGDRDRNGGSLNILTDGAVAVHADQPSKNFFFRAGSNGGRVQFDLGSVIAVTQVNTYSWHPNSRAPQVYKLYASDGSVTTFDPWPKRGIDPETCGWQRVATVDTRSTDGQEGGQYGVAIVDQSKGLLGNYRYLLFDISHTQNRDPFSNTFFSEIDVLDANGAESTTSVDAIADRVTDSFHTDDERYHFTIDSTLAPDLTQWAHDELQPVVVDWYPKLVTLLPSDGFAPATNITLTFRNDMGGTPASAGGSTINMNTDWFRRELNREARGSVVHEMVHVVQSYGRARRANPNARRTPGWVVEGIADYVRWFLYEPETKGAEITQRNFDRANFDSSYRVTANFLNWLTTMHDPEIVRKLNAAARNGIYDEDLWEDWTGTNLQKLGHDWKIANKTQIDARAR